MEGLRAAVLLLATWLSCGHGELMCSKFGPCFCEGNGFSKINVERVLRDSVDQPIRDPFQPEKYEYLVNFCHGRICFPNKDGGLNSVACKLQIDGQKNVSIKLGDLGEPVWQVFDNNTYSVKFGNGDFTGDGVRFAMMYIFVANKTSDIPFNNLTFMEERKDPRKKFFPSDPDTFNYVSVFNLYITTDELKKEGEGGHIVGYIFMAIIILVLLAILAYFIIGSILMYTVKGARGVKVIPHYNFWKALPGHIKDGFMIIISPCKRLAGRGKSYQSF